MTKPLWIGCLQRLRGSPMPDDPKDTEDTEDLMNLYHAYRALDGVELAAVPLRTNVLVRLAAHLNLPVSTDGSSTLVASPEWPESVLVAGVRRETAAVERAIHLVGAQVAGTEPGVLPAPPAPAVPLALPAWTQTLDALCRVPYGQNTEEARGSLGVASAFRDPKELQRTLTDLHRARMASLDVCASITLYDKNAYNLLFDALGRPPEVRSLVVVNREEGSLHVAVGGQPYLQAEVVRAVDRAAVLAIRCWAHEPRAWGPEGTWTGGRAEKPNSVPPPSVEEVDAILRAQFSRSEKVGTWRLPGYILELQKAGIRVTTFGLTEDESLLQYERALRERFTVERDKEGRAVVVTGWIDPSAPKA